MKKLAISESNFQKGFFHKYTLSPWAEGDMWDIARGRRPRPRDISHISAEAQGDNVFITGEIFITFVTFCMLIYRQKKQKKRKKLLKMEVGYIPNIALGYMWEWTKSELHFLKLSIIE